MDHVELNFEQLNELTKRLTKTGDPDALVRIEDVNLDNTIAAMIDGKYFLVDQSGYVFDWNRKD